MFKWLKRKPSQPTLSLKNPPEWEVDERALELVSLGNKMYATEDFKGAIEAYDSALRVDGHCAAAWYRRGRYFMHENRILEAAACYVRALELDPKAADAWSGLGEAILAFFKADKEPLFIRENRVELLSEARACFDRAIKTGSNAPRARQGYEESETLLKQDAPKLTTPPIFSFQSGGILEDAKRKVVTSFLKPGDYRRKTLPPIQND